MQLNTHRYIASAILDSLQATRWEHSEYTYVHASNTRIHTRIHIFCLAVIRACETCVARKVAQCCIANCITCTHIACIAQRSLALSLSTFTQTLPFSFPSSPSFLSLSLSLPPLFFHYIYSFLSSNLLFTLIFCHHPPCVILHFRCCAHFLRGFLSYFVYFCYSRNSMDLLCIQFFKRINFYPLKIHIYVYAHIDIIYSMIMIN